MANKTTKLKRIVDSEYEKYLSRLSFEIRKEILNNFDQQKDINGKKFKRLAKSTRLDRVRNNFPAASPILRRTGKLRDSIKVEPDLSTKSLKIESSLEYADDLSKGNHSGVWGRQSINVDMPERNFLGEPKSLRYGSKKRNDIFSKFNENVISKLQSEIDDIIKKL
tara:strand:- start:189 stop:686 length:498 start_codon:yes stop_codon:yes gene_type:complete